MATTEMRRNGTSSQSVEVPETATIGGGSDDDVKPKPSMIKRFVNKTGLDGPTLLMMFKGSLPPTIGIAMYQSHVISSYFKTQGYLISIISVLALAFLPRDKFIQNLLLNLIFICLGAAMSLLAIWSSVQARLHTSPPLPAPTPGAAPTPPPYNSSQSAVCGVWLFFNIWLTNLIRAKRPSFNTAVILYTIMIDLSTTYGPGMTTTKAAEDYVEELFRAMLFGVGLATGVALFIFPTSSRMVVMKRLKGLIGQLREITRLQRKYMAELAKRDEANVRASTEKAKGTHGPAAQTDTGKRLVETIHAIRALLGQLYGDISFAKRDTAWGKLDGHELTETSTLIRNIIIPVISMSTVTDIFQRLTEHRGWTADETSREKQMWIDVMERMDTPLQLLAQLTDHGLEHAGRCLEILPSPKKSKQKFRRNTPDGIDLEALHAGGPGFASVLDNKARYLKSCKGTIVREFKERWWASEEENILERERLTSGKEQDHTPLYVILYMEQLFGATATAVQNLVVFADGKVQDGTMAHNRFIFPTGRLLKKWVKNVFQRQESKIQQTPDILTYRTFGESYGQRKDPEHLPARTPWQHFGNGLRKISAVLSSRESVFGFHVACGTMCVAIIAFLEPTERFFREQRVIWAIITVALGMTITSGQSIFGFILRLAGTLIGMICSFIIWYAADQNTGGVIFLLWLFIFMEYYFLKYPRFLVGLVFVILTQIIIVGYELQVQKLGLQVATSTGQPYYPIYKLAPFRFIGVAAGSTVAFFWTIFPSPLTDRTWIRQDVSATMFLLANYISVINSTMKAQLHGAGDVTSKTSPAYHLQKARGKVFGKIIRLMPSMESHLWWQRVEPTIGGQFPAETYKDIIMRTSRMMSYLTIMSYALTSPMRTLHNLDSPLKGQEDGGDGSGDILTDEARAEEVRWRRALTQVLPIVNAEHHMIVSTLTLLSSSMLSGRSLPPFLLAPHPHEATNTPLRMPDPDRAGDSASNDPLISLRNFKFDVMDVRRQAAYQSGGESRIRKRGSRTPGEEAHCADSGSSGTMEDQNEARVEHEDFVLVQVCTALVLDDLRALVRAVSGLVGVVDFSIRVNEDGKVNQK